MMRHLERDTEIRVSDTGTADPRKQDTEDTVYIYIYIYIYIYLKNYIYDFFFKLHIQKRNIDIKIHILLETRRFT
jgi:hypothetical protein